jgi:hypothetical protein
MRTGLKALRGRKHPWLALSGLLPIVKRPVQNGAGDATMILEPARHFERLPFGRRGKPRVQPDQPEHL